MAKSAIGIKYLLFSLTAVCMNTTFDALKGMADLDVIIKELTCNSTGWQQRLELPDIEYDDELIGEKIILRKITPKYATACAHMLSDDVIQRLGWTLPMTQAQKELHVRWCQEQTESGDWCSYLIFPKISPQQPIGHIDIRDYRQHPAWAEMGYWLNENYRGKGFCPEAGKLILGHFFSKTPWVQYCVTEVRTGNVSSQKASERIGFTKTNFQIYRFNRNNISKEQFNALPTGQKNHLLKNKNLQEYERNVNYIINPHYDATYIARHAKSDHNLEPYLIFNAAAGALACLACAAFADAKKEKSSGQSVKSSDKPNTMNDENKEAYQDEEELLTQDIPFIFSAQ